MSRALSAKSYSYALDAKDKSGVTEPNSEWHPVVTVPRTEPFWSQFHNPLHINDVGGVGDLSTPSCHTSVEMAPNWPEGPAIPYFTA